MDLQDRYDELDNIESTLRLLISEISDKDYIEEFEEIMFRAQTEKEKVEEQLIEEREKEERAIDYFYERSVV